MLCIPSHPTFPRTFLYQLSPISYIFSLLLSTRSFLHLNMLISPHLKKISYSSIQHFLLSAILSLSFHSLPIFLEELCPLTLSSSYHPSFSRSLQCYHPTHTQLPTKGTSSVFWANPVSTSQSHSWKLLAALDIIDQSVPPWDSLPWMSSLLANWLSCLPPTSLATLYWFLLFLSYSLTFHIQ